MDNRLRRFWRNLGPGLVTGASDDDPSGIATYTQAGALFGLKLLWTALITFPMMVVVQEMCARIGIVTGRGLAATIKAHYPPWVLGVVVVLSVPAIILNIAADIAGMGAVAAMIMPGVPSWVFSVAFMCVLMYGMVMWSYRRIASVLKWLCISLLAYLIIPFIERTDWLVVLRSAVVPEISWTRDYLLVLVGIFGTTISPYLFFWQASAEVEESAANHVVVDKAVVRTMNNDVRSGMFFASLVFFFIVLTSGSVLHNADTGAIITVEDAARSLRPLAGDLAYALFALGVIGTGLIAIPVLAGALSYMTSEVFAWEEGLSKKPRQAPGFYVTMGLAVVLGLTLDILRIDPITALLWTAVLYGVTAPVLIGLVIHICNRPDIMGPYTNDRITNIIAITTLAVMAAAVVSLLVC
jgi:NRAMP (natural resistance-associated macrophage protein)-like metal ion transporter